MKEQKKETREELETIQTHVGVLIPHLHQVTTNVDSKRHRVTLLLDRASQLIDIIPEGKDQKRAFVTFANTIAGVYK